MRLPTTLGGYMSLFNKISTSLIPGALKGYDDLPEETKIKIQELESYFVAQFGEIESEYLEYKNASKKTKK